MFYTVIGGQIAGDVDLTIDGELPVTVEKYVENKVRAKVLGIPEVEVDSLRGRKIAVAAGGPSIHEHIDTLKAWDGEVWAINGTYRWCMDRGIEATLVVIDPHPIVLRWAKGAHKAIVGDTCDPEVFELLKGADVRQIRIAADGIKGTSSTATMVPFLAGHTSAAGVTFFGCESSFVGDSHAYMHEERDDQLIITAGDGDYLTYSDFLLQARELSAMIRALGGYLTEESGGLLRALVKNPEHRIKWISQAYAERMRPVQPCAHAAD